MNRQHCVFDILRNFKLAMAQKNSSKKTEGQFVACYWLQTWAPITTCHTASEFPGLNDSSLTHLQPRPVFSYLWMNFVNLELILIAGTMDKLRCLLVNLFITPVLLWLIKQLNQKTLHTIHLTWKVLTEEPTINTKFLYFLLQLLFVSMAPTVFLNENHSLKVSDPTQVMVSFLWYHGFSMSFLSPSEPHGNW